MANTKSAQKRVRSNVRKTEQNAATKSKVRNLLKNVRALAAEGKKEEAVKALNQTASALDKAVKRGTIHKGTASRRKSTLAKVVGAVAASATA
jgi:small subunit ribosomal protein S20